MTDETKDAGTAEMTLTTAPTERDKAMIRLSQAAMLHAMAVLQANANVAATVADVNDLSFRRDGGKIDMSTLFDVAAQEKTMECLVEAARVFAKLDLPLHMEQHMEQFMRTNAQMFEGTIRVLQAQIEALHAELNAVRDGNR